MRHTRFRLVGDVINSMKILTIIIHRTRKIAVKDSICSTSMFHSKHLICDAIKIELETSRDG